MDSNTGRSTLSAYQKHLRKWIEIMVISKAVDEPWDHGQNGTWLRWLSSSIWLSPYILHEVETYIFCPFIGRHWMTYLPISAPLAPIPGYRRAFPSCFTPFLSFQRVLQQLARSGVAARVISPASLRLGCSDCSCERSFYDTVPTRSMHNARCRRSKFVYLLLAPSLWNEVTIC